MVPVEHASAFDARLESRGDFTHAGDLRGLPS
jgi:hypothetical protein